MVGNPQFAPDDQLWRHWGATNLAPSTKDATYTEKRGRSAAAAAAAAAHCYVEKGAHCIQGYADVSVPRW